METIRTHKALIKAIYNAINGISLDEVKRQRDTKRSRLNMLFRAHERYLAAHDAAEKFGFIGVGCITFAEVRLAKFCCKVGIPADA